MFQLTDAEIQTAINALDNSAEDCEKAAKAEGMPSEAREMFEQSAAKYRKLARKLDDADGVTLVVYTENGYVRAYCENRGLKTTGGH